ncbi:hypothetical protein [Acinetobacter sp. YH12251]|uniref:hypothetical protein n=1 Tax=Acinetobacter sp. YH12251 TaxID=2601176 RepID=UPI0015D196D9|nr:hypothetical protein [Acinetobacter sp. YH12251]
MSTKLGALTLDLVAKIGNFIGPIQDSEKQVKISFENMRKHVNTYGTALATVGASAVTALAGMAYATAQQAVELEKFAFRANTTTQDFQRMAVGAQAYGIEQEKLSDMMKDFNEKLGELTTIGAGGGVDFFEQIAVKTEGSAEAAEKLILKMQKLSGPEALQLYVDKLEEAGVTQQQMSFYLESMASDMTDLIPLLMNGGEGMDLYADAADRAGLIMSDSTIKSAAILKEQVYLLDLQLQGAKNQLMQAVIPAFVDIADAFFSGSEQGAQFSDVADTVADGLRYVAKVAIGAATAVQLVGKVIGGLMATGQAILTGNISQTQSIQDAMIADLDATMIASADRIDKITRGSASSTARQLAAVRQLGSNTKGVNAGLGELVDKQNKATKSAKANTKANADLNRILEEQQRIIYDYASGPLQKEIELEKEIKRLRKNGMSEYISMAEARFEQEKKLAEMQIGFEVSEHKLTAKRKLEYSFNIRHQEVMADAKLTKEQRDGKIQALNEMYKIETDKLRIAQSKQLLEAKRHWISAADYAKEYYTLIREEILNTAEYSPEMKQSLVKEANFNQGLESNAEREQVWGDYKSMMGLDKSPYQEDMDLLAEARKHMLLTEEEYQQQRLTMQMSYGSQYGADFAGMMMGLVDSSSAAYAILGGVQKGFALFSTALNSYQAISAAWASAPFPYNLPAVAMATMETGLLQAAVSALSPVGMAHNGIDNIPKEGTWLLDGGERVLNPQQNKDLTNYLNDKQTQAAPAQGQQLTIINQVDRDDLVGGYIRSPVGGQTVLNLIKANPSDFKAALGIA